MTFKEILEMVVADTDEDIYSTEVTTRIKSYINRGYMSLARLENLETTINSTISNGRVIRPDNAIKILSIQVDNIPVEWYEEGSYLYVSSDGRCKVIYNYNPDTLINDSDELETNIGNYEYILNYAIWKYYLYEDDNEKAKVYKVEMDKMDILKKKSAFRKIVDVYGVN